MKADEWRQRDAERERVCVYVRDVGRERQRISPLGINVQRAVHGSRTQSPFTQPFAQDRNQWAKGLDPRWMWSHKSRTRRYLCSMLAVLYFPSALLYNRREQR